MTEIFKGITPELVTAWRIITLVLATFLLYFGSVNFLINLLENELISFWVYLGLVVNLALI